jgi:hypothetical protein
MATFIPNITDTFPEPYIYKPDLAFYDKMLQRKTALYEQGVSKARSAYESVLNAPLSNKYNIPIRDQYIKQARENLMKIAGADFSQAQNVASAQGIFAPFWEDKFIVQDAQLTKHYQGQMQILDGWKNNTDPKIRENYNGIVAKDLNNGLDVLVNAERTDAGFSNIEKRKAVPFTNLEKYLNEQAGKEGLKIKWAETSSDGAYLIEIENGERSKKHFATWAESMLGNNFYEQFAVTGRVEHEERFKQYKTNFPTLTNQQINEKIANDVVGEFDKGYQKRKNYIKTEVARINGLLNSLPANLTPEYQQATLQYQKQKAELLSRSDAIDKEYELNFTKNYQEELKNNIILNPTGFFGKLSKQRVVDNWSTGVASLESRTIKVNETFFKAQETQLNQRKFDLEVLEYDLRKQEAEWKRDQELWERNNPSDQKTGQTGTTTNSLGQIVDKKGRVITAPVQGIDPQTGGRYVGPGVTNVIKEGTAAEVFDRGQKELFQSSYSLAFSADGLLYFAKAGLGLDDGEITSVVSAMDNELRSGLFSPGAPEYTFTPEQKKAVDKLAKSLIENSYVKQAGITKITGPGTLRNALLAYTKGYLNDRVNEAKNNKNPDGTPAPLDFVLTDQERKALINYNVAKNNLEMYLANEENKKKLIADYVKGHPDVIGKFFIKNKENSYEFATPQTLAKDMPTLEITGYDDLNDKKSLNKEEVARLFIQGKLSYTKDGELIVDNKRYYISKLNGKPRDGFGGLEREWNTTVYEGIVNKYGKSQEFSKQIKDIYGSLVPNLLYFKNETGKVGSNFSYRFDPNVTDDKSFVLFEEVLEQGNATIYIEEKGVIREATVSEQEAIRKFKRKEKDAEQYFGGFTYSTTGGGLIAGRTNISIDFGPITDGSKIVLGSEKLTDLAGKKFIFAINEGGSNLAMNLKDLPRNSGYYIYQSLLRGKTFKSDEMMNATGFNFTLTPDKDGSTSESIPDNVRLNLKYKVRITEIDPVTKEMKTRLEDREVTDKVFNLREKTPDEIIFEIQKIYFDNLQANFNEQQKYENYLKQRQKQQPGTGASVISKDAFFTQHGINTK